MDVRGSGLLALYRQKLNNVPHVIVLPALKQGAALVLLAEI